MKLILGEKAMKQAGDLFIYLLRICHGSPAEKEQSEPQGPPLKPLWGLRFMEREDMLAHVQAGNSYHSCVPGVPGVSGQLTGKAQILPLLWKWDYFTKCQRQKGGGLGFRFQKEDGQEEESGMRTNIIIPPSGREGAWGLCFFFPFPLSDCICPLEIQPSDYLQEPLTQAQFSTLSIPGIKQGGKKDSGNWAKLVDDKVQTV